VPRPHSVLSPPSILGAAALLGAATGLRSQMGLAAVVLHSAPDRLPTPLRSRAARSTAALAAVGELVADKLPTAPARTAPVGLAARVGGAAGAAWLVGRSRGTAVVPEMAVAAGVAVGTAFGGMTVRARLSRRFPPTAVALTEDVVAIALAGVGCMMLRSR
jgi:uncharacterized membrane protein